MFSIFHQHLAGQNDLLSWRMAKCGLHIPSVTRYLRRRHGIIAAAALPAPAVAQQANQLHVRVTLLAHELVIFDLGRVLCCKGV